MLKWVTLILGTLALVYVSRSSLFGRRRTHGFYRFFAWELLLLLIVLNMDDWYLVPLGMDQIVSRILMNISFLLVIIAYLSLRLFGHHDVTRNDDQLLPLEKTTALVSEGIYRYIRHPMYSSLLFLDFGLFFKQMSWLRGFIAFIACVLLVLTARAEENENIRYFGVQYQKYIRRTKRFIPFLL